MRLRIAALADYASVSQGNKLNIMGIFGIIHASKMPARHMEMRLVVQMVFEPDEAGERHIKIYLQDEDGQDILRLEGNIIVPPASGPEPIILNQILKLQNIVFPRFGSYEFKLEIDGETNILAPVDVVPIPGDVSSRH